MRSLLGMGISGAGEVLKKYSGRGEIRSLDDQRQQLMEKKRTIRRESSLGETRLCGP